MRVQLGVGFGREEGVPKTKIGREIAYRHPLAVSVRQIAARRQFEQPRLAYRVVDRKRDVRLQPVREIVQPRHVPLPRMFVPCAVQPQLAYLAVFAAQKFGQMRAHQVVIGGVVLVTRLVTVPKRIVQPQLNAVFLARLRHLGDDVGRAGRLVDAIVGRRGVPKAKSVMVLCDQDDIVHPRLIGVAHPAVRVDRRRAIAGHGQAPVRPLGVEKGVDPEMNEHAVLALHLSALRGVGQCRRRQCDHIFLPAVIRKYNVTCKSSFVNIRKIGG